MGERANVTQGSTIIHDGIVTERQKEEKKKSTGGGN